MSLNDKCVKCGSSDIIRQAVVVADPGNAAAAETRVQIRVDTRPQAILFHKPVRSPLRASVCAGCGYVEFYATDYGSLHTAFVAAQESSHNSSR